MLAAASSFAGPWREKQVSLKGDDSCGLHNSVLEVTIHPGKTHIEESMVELEKCIVTKSGFGGCLLRKIGSIVYAEHQGKPTLAGPELVNFIFESTASLERRNAKSGICRKWEIAMMVTGGMDR